MTRQTLFNLAALTLLVLLALITANIARSLRRIERLERHRLVRWHLMSPPVVPFVSRGSAVSFNEAAPLSQWAIVETFPTEEECEAYRRCQGFHGPIIATTGRFIVRDRGIATDQCVAADDPRLKEK
jgi:hypothetical protein